MTTTMNRAGSILAKTFTRIEPQYGYNKSGKYERLDLENVTKDDLAFALLHVRMIEEEEMWKVTGVGPTFELIRKGYLRRDPRFPWQLYVTQKGAENYGLVGRSKIAGVLVEFVD